MSLSEDKALDQRLWAEIRLKSLPRSLREAQAQGAPYYFTGQPCANGHYAERKTSDKHCVECQKLYQNRYNQRHREARNAASKAYRQAHREELNHKRKLYTYYGTSRIHEREVLVMR